MEDNLKPPFHNPIAYNPGPELDPVLAVWLPASQKKLDLELYWEFLKDRIRWMAERSGLTPREMEASLGTFNTGATNAEKDPGTILDGWLQNHLMSRLQEEWDPREAPLAENPEARKAMLDMTLEDWLGSAVPPIANGIAR